MSIRFDNIFKRIEANSSNAKNIYFVELGLLNNYVGNCVVCMKLIHSFSEFVFVLGRLVKTLVVRKEHCCVVTDILQITFTNSTELTVLERLKILVYSGYVDLAVVERC